MANFTEKVRPLSFEGEGRINIKEKEITYTWIARDLVVKAADGAEAFAFFSFAYLRNDISAEERKKRPLVFAFNGGPTSCSTWMHLGFWGPRILVPGADGLPDQIHPGSLRDNLQSCQNM